MSHSFSSVPRSVGRSDLNRLMHYHDRQFVELTYRLLLGRPADDEGLGYYLACIRSGESRREIAFRIGDSAEAKAAGLNTDLFKLYRRWRRIERIPLLGSLILMIICLVRFRRLVREFRRIQNAVFGGPAAASMPVSR